jgi:hypothetical protein
MANPGTVTIPGQGVTGDEIVLRKENSYADVLITLGPDWSAYLDGSYTIYFTAKSRYTEDNTTNFFSVVCSVSDQSTGVISVDLTVSNLDIDVGQNYWWQIQIVDSPTSPTEVKTPVTGNLAIIPTVRDIE